MLYRYLYIIGLGLFNSSIYADIGLNGDAQGQIIETNNCIILNGVRVTQQNGHDAAIEIDNPYNKCIIAKDVHVTTRNGNYQSHGDGVAAAVKINTRGSRHVNINNLTVDARGHNRSTVENDDSSQICTGIVCIQQQENAPMSYEKIDVEVNLPNSRYTGIIR